MTPLMISVLAFIGVTALIGYLVGFQIITCGIARIALSMATRKTAWAPSAGRSADRPSGTCRAVIR